jgi:hypothetical protein
LRDGLLVARRVEDGVPVLVDNAGCFEILPRDVPFEPRAGDADGVEGEGPDTGVLAALVEFDGEEDIGRLRLPVGGRRVVLAVLEVGVVEDWP